MRTECTAPSFKFQEVAGRAVVARFDGGALTSDGGAVVLREVERTTGVLRQFAACFHDYRDPARTTHSVARLVRQRVYALALGYEDLNDHDALRHDPLFAVLAEADDLGAPLAGKSTLNRLELSGATIAEAERYKKIAVDHAAVDRLLVDVFIQAHAHDPTPPEEIILDLDATDDPVHGQQEGRFFHGFYGHYCYLPLYIFAGDHLLCARLRPSNIDASAGVLDEVPRLVAQLRAVWPDVRIVLRADSGFCRDALLTWCEAHGVDYVIGLAKNDRLIALITDELADAAAQCAATGRPARVFAELTYQTRDSWSRARRVVAKAEQLTPATRDDEGKRNPRFVVTSLGRERIDARALYEDVYCARGEMENRIKEQQLMLFADRTSAATMRANQLRLYFSSIAYVLVHALRRLALAGTTLARGQVTTIRLTLLKIGARVRVTTRKVWLALASGCPHATLFATVHATLRALPRHPMHPIHPIHPIHPMRC
ncbi:MAG TPA: IS1380 family transposase [Vicinamibacterales bacterium]|nr:IS1380 family transposase [Vicinamibacterales bacterium]